MISRDEAVELLHEHVKTDTLRAHCRETELIMRALAEKLGEDPGLWGLAGLLHDIDFEETKDTPEKHGLPAVDILKKIDLPESAVNAICRHNGEMNGNSPTEKFDYALRCGETITGLLVATALVRPDKKLETVKVKSVKKKFKDKRFAANCSRDVIMECEKLGLPLAEFIEISLDALKPHADEFGI